MTARKTYARCDACGARMNPRSGCRATRVRIGGRDVARVPYDGSGDNAQGVCHDCNVRRGAVHHAGCDMERCPDCGLQMIGCDCPITHYVRPA